MSNAPAAYGIDTRDAQPLVRQVPGADVTCRYASGRNHHLADRPVGLRQDHAAALLQPGERALRLRDAPPARSRSSARTSTTRRLAGRAAQGRRHGVPAAQPAAALGLRERGLRPARPHGATAADQSGARRGGREGAHRGRAVERPEGPAGQPGHELQLEQQQKLCIARLLPLKPEVILMDEPCSALDVGGHARHRGADVRPARALHDRDRHPQHGAGPPGQRRVHLHAAGRAHRAHAAPRICSSPPATPAPPSTSKAATASLAKGVALLHSAGRGSRQARAECRSRQPVASTTVARRYEPEDSPRTRRSERTCLPLCACPSSGAVLVVFLSRRPVLLLFPYSRQGRDNAQVGPSFLDQLRALAVPMKVWRPPVRILLR